VFERAGPRREVTAAQAAATLARLHAPAGFSEVSRCRFAERGSAQKCFWTARALPIDAPAIRRIVTFERARPWPASLLAGCSGPHHWHQGLVLRACHWAFELGPELVLLSVDSLLVPPGRARSRFALRALRWWRSGTEIRMTVIGHWPHDKEPPE
jgi:hypothetical protein